MKTEAEQIEDDVESYLKKRCDAVGALCEKTVTLGRRGRPDREITWPWGVMDLVELKRPKGGRYEPGQENDHKERAKRGVPVYLLNTKEKVDLYFVARAVGEHLPALFSVPVPRLRSEPLPYPEDANH